MQLQILEGLLPVLFPFPHTQCKSQKPPIFSANHTHTQSRSLSLAVCVCVYLCLTLTLWLPLSVFLSVCLSVSVSLCVTRKRKERERRQIEQQSGATIEQDQKRSWKPIRPQPELKLHSESKSIRIVCMCVCLCLSLCLSGGHETAHKTPMKDKTQNTITTKTEKRTWSILSKSIWSVSVSHSLEDHETHSKLARSARQNKNTMKKERNAQKLEVRSKTKQRMDLSFFLSFFLSVCLFPLLVLILVLFPFIAAPPEAKRHDSKHQKQNGSTRRRAGRTLHGIPSVVEAAAAGAKRRRTRERERERERERQQSGHKTRYQTRDDFLKVLTTSAATL